MNSLEETIDSLARVNEIVNDTDTPGFLLRSLVKEFNINAFIFEKQSMDNDSIFGILKKVLNVRKSFREHWKPKKH